MNLTDLKEFLDEKVVLYNRPDFILTDPIQIPHYFTLKEDIEISAFLTATIAWGNRKMIINNARKLMQLMDDAPYDFILNHAESDLERFNGFVHRTFNADDLRFFITSIKNIYLNHQGMETVFQKYLTETSTQLAIHEFKKLFFSLEHPKRTEKHVGDPNKGSAAKRLNMMLRWLVRSNHTGVDFGIWKSIPTSALSCPLDVHSGNVARKLGLLTRKQNDAKALAELDISLRKLDPIDPVKYDFALFGLGAFENF
ncbi:TIGR02757 family protein [Tamlana fucoidanivorans]|uniref:TIGR02757 family protein n=1 Tax=Allotamlana fucoidanivorans TaxID=2583814 RepID=A0A5C4SJ16_9FLAO|nr:TIGR02757 family protein [Tamlana fucoidanivorans]TNJ43084.1 TIGR02757 family protein [Tamlana fucoidanivorans]